MGRPAGWMKELTGRSAMKSPGKPSHRREVELWFWREIAKGLSTEDAAAAVGVSSAAGSRWFRERGGMATLLRDPVSCRYLCFVEREEIALLRAEGKGVREIAREIGRSPSTISRELSRNAESPAGKLDYRPSGAPCYAPRRQARVPPVGGAVACRAARQAPEAREAGGQPSVARLRGRALGRRDTASRRPAGRWSAGRVEGTAPRPSQGPPLGPGVEPGADRGPAGGRLPG